ncbi:MAG: sigma-70 family RNA polymerase sigma factor [Bryobacteraceae bacterium]
MVELRQQEDNVTVLIEQWKEGEASALGKLMPLIYSELRRLARAQIAGERANHTLQPTALVHEVYLRLSGSAPPPVEGRKQFYGVAARVMRQILVDHARRYLRAKRGGGAPAVALRHLLPGPPTCAADLLALDQALDRLNAIDERKARGVELRYFAGLEMAEVAEILSISVMTLHRDLRFSTAWLAGQLRHRE